MTQDQRHPEPLFGQTTPQFQFHSPHPQPHVHTHNYFSHSEDPGYHYEQGDAHRHCYHDNQQNPHYSNQRDCSPRLPHWDHSQGYSHSPHWRERSPDRSRHLQSDDRSWSNDSSYSSGHTSHSRYPIGQSNEWFDKGKHRALHLEPRHVHGDFVRDSKEHLSRPPLPVSLPPPKVVKKIVPAESIFDSPGRKTRPSHVCFQNHNFILYSNSLHCCVSFLLFVTRL